MTTAFGNYAVSTPAITRPFTEEMRYIVHGGEMMTAVVLAALETILVRKYRALKKAQEAKRAAGQMSGGDDSVGSLTLIMVCVIQAGFSTREFLHLRSTRLFSIFNLLFQQIYISAFF